VHQRCFSLLDVLKSQGKSYESDSFMLPDLARKAANKIQMLKC